MPPGFVDQAYAEAGIRCHNSLYSPAVVMWLLILQRLEGGAPLGAAVCELLRGLPSEFWPRPCKRIRDWREQGKAPSSNTGAYNHARQALPLAVVQRTCDRIFEGLIGKLKTSAEGSRRAFLLDGSSMRLAHSPELCRRYPAGSNQHGPGHWPVLKIVVAHDLQTGLAARPTWGAMYGPDAVSEQRLLETAIERLPAGSIIVADANFGVLSVAWVSRQRQHPVVLRLTAARARKLAGAALHDGIDREVEWKPSAYERKHHPEMPADAHIQGRLIVRQVQPDTGGKPFLLALFTTLPGTQQEILEIYGQRWRIETDLRTLKSNLKLDQLTCATEDMVAKEIDMAMAAYNLVRAVTCQASEQSGIPPRGYSFTRVQRVLQTFGPMLEDAKNGGEAKRIFDQIMHYVQQAKLPQRKRKRPSYPREVWQRGAYFPTRKK